MAKKATTQKAPAGAAKSSKPPAAVATGKTTTAAPDAPLPQPSKPVRPTELGDRDGSLMPVMLSCHLGCFDVDCWPGNGPDYVFARRICEPGPDGSYLSADWSGRAILFPPIGVVDQDLKDAIHKVDTEAREYLLVLPAGRFATNLIGGKVLEDWPGTREVRQVPYAGGVIIAVGESIAEALHNAAALEIV